jgi:hypothetical protein
LRIIPAVFIAVVVASPTIARAQGVSVHAAGGPTLVDAGRSFAGGIGFSPGSRLTIMANVERTHLPSKITVNPGSASYFRGGTFTLATAELRVSIFGRDRIGPYALAGFGVGRSRPNVNAIFPTPAVSDVRAPFAGGGVQVPLGDRLTLFGDWRLALIVGVESDDLYALQPIRAGLSWRF